jgi:hypothetical protein
LAHSSYGPTHLHELIAQPIPIAGQASLMIDQGITEGNYSLLYSGRRPLSILAQLDVSHCPWFERLGSFTAAGYRIQTDICGGSA